MDLHRLTLRAIGPYAGEHTIDFRALGQSGVFLLEGPTGSGKSTVIDALVFALYGQLAGETASNDRLHSHHAAATLEPFVELVFETPAGIHRVRRTPQWWRPKSRGEGVTRANASATLMRLATPDATTGEVLSTSAQEVGGEITRIVGLTRQQFVQTVVLPQGEFARFLSASGEDRRLVLQSLFGTEVYERTTAQLVGMRRDAHASVSAADRAVDLALERVREAAGDPEAGGDPDVAADDAASLVEMLRGEAAAARVVRDEAQRGADRARTVLAEQRRLADALTRRASLLERKASLDEGARRAESDRSRLDLGRRAAAVSGPLAALLAADVRRDSAATRLGVLEAEHPELADRPADVLRSERDTLVADVAAIERLAVLEAGLSVRREKAARDAVDIERIDHEVAAATAALSARPADRAPLVARAEAAAVAVRDVTQAERGVAEAEAARARVARYEVLVAAVAAANVRRGLLAEVATHAVAAEATLRARRISGMAGELALSLVAGEACSVCGSTEHPAPAVLVAEHPDDETIDRAAAERERAERDLAGASTEFATAEARRLDTATDLAGASPESAATALETARQVLAASQVTAAEAGVAADAVVAFDAATDAARGALEAARVSRAGASAALAAAQTTLDDDADRVAAELGGRADSAGVLASLLAASRAALDDLLSAIGDHAAAVEDRDERAAALAAAVTEAGFTDADGASAAALDRPALAALEADVARYDSERAVVAAGLGEPGIAALTGSEEIDLEAAAVVASEADGALAEGSRILTRADDRRSRTEAAVAALVEAVAGGAAVADRARAVVRMADIAAASGPVNTRGVTLGTYVLLRRFDDVLAAANARLAVMSSGRYELEASESRESGSRARKTGLALTIRDHATDTTRDPKSFSGGETFYASLSLALGLADVVQAEAGGLDLGTLFVDEGFGSLDPETLDAVMTELGHLSAHGRVVGIVSHVEELKQRIADRIEVRRLPDGSSTLSSTVSAAPAHAHPRPSSHPHPHLHPHP